MAAAGRRFRPRQACRGRSIPIPSAGAASACAVTTRRARRRDSRCLRPPHAVGRVYLVDIEGKVQHTWTLPYPPGLYGDLTPRGTLFYNGQIKNDTFIGQTPFMGGAVMEVDWRGKVLWELKQPDHHHDGRLLRNGNVLLVDWSLGAPPLSGQHAPVALPNGRILLFDNGPFRVDTGAQPFSRVLEIDPATKQIAWTYEDGLNAGSRHFFFSSRVSNAQRLPNGNTLINEGLYGRFFEVTPDGDVVWEYVNPHFGPATSAAKGQTNNVFRVYRYAAEEIAVAQRG